MWLNFDLGLVYFFLCVYSLSIRHTVIIANKPKAQVKWAHITSKEENGD